MRVLHIADERARQAFAERAAIHFAEHPTHRTYANGDPAAGEMLAIRWGMHDRAVLVLRVGDEDPVVYADAIACSEGNS